MIDLSTEYMGLKLKNPIIAASSGMTDSVDKIKKLADNGVAAVVLKSLFEEQIRMEIDSLGMNNMFNSYSDTESYIAFYTKQNAVSEYLKLIQVAKKAVDIPVIASINCYSMGEWVEFAEKIEKAGADGIELNMFILPGDTETKGEEIEKKYFDIIENVTKHTSLPVSVKLSHYFSGMGEIFKRISETRVKGMILFNRFYSPDVDLDNEEIVSSRVLSLPEENSMCIRWIGMLSNKVSSDLCASTGIMDGKDALKNILVGAKAVQVASTLYKNKPEQIGVMLKQIEDWLKQKGYKSIDEIRGKLNTSKLNMERYERAQFMKYYSNYE
ncbi:MAG: dihydroorotate dehydrogenase-like protein [Bacteroidetes bacterium]|nr:dihydroorotate dehydrogenase-like protein [Bacteroidota bacterium]